MDASLGNNCRRIVHPHTHTYGQSHHCSQMGVILAALGDLTQTRLDALIQTVLEEQILAGVAGQRQFRKYDQIHILRICFIHICTNIVRVLYSVTHFNRWHCAGNSDIVEHRIPPECLSGVIISHSAQIANEI